MMGTVAALWRHPIKSHGREALQETTLVSGQAMPWDRHWAVTHNATKATNGAWAMCRNFMIGTLTPGLAGLWATFTPETGRITLRHQDLGEITFHPDDRAEAAQFLEWVAPLSLGQSMEPTGLISAGSRGMTDTDYASVSMMNTASHRAVAAQIRSDIAPERWRGNIWLDDLPAWAEWDWIGRRIKIGAAVLAVQDRIQRCNHTKSNPVTGQRDVDTLGALNAGFGHQDFGVYATVEIGGTIRLGDKIEVL